MSRTIDWQHLLIEFGSVKMNQLNKEVSAVLINHQLINCTRTCASMITTNSSYYTLLISRHMDTPFHRLCLDITYTISFLCKIRKENAAHNDSGPPIKDAYYILVDYTRFENPSRVVAAVYCGYTLGRVYIVPFEVPCGTCKENNRIFRTSEAHAYIKRFPIAYVYFGLEGLSSLE